VEPPRLGQACTGKIRRGRRPSRGSRSRDRGHRPRLSVRGCSPSSTHWTQVSEESRQLDPAGRPQWLRQREVVEVTNRDRNEEQLVQNSARAVELTRTRSPKLRAAEDASRSFTTWASEGLPEAEPADGLRNGKTSPSRFAGPSLSRKRY